MHRSVLSATVFGIVLAALLAFAIYQSILLKWEIRQAVQDTRTAIADVRQGQQDLEEALDQMDRRHSQNYSELKQEVEEFQFEAWDSSLDVDHQRHLYYSSIRNGVDPDVIFSIAWHESGFNPEAVNFNTNGTLDVGYMQINESAWSHLEALGFDVHNPYGNIDAGIYLVVSRMEHYTLEQSLAAYAAGESGMKRGNGKWFVEELIEILYTRT